MNTTSMPGFTAENSISGPRGQYGMAITFDSQNASSNVQPALAKICDVLAELLWGAYNEGAYNRAQFWSNVMERGGCFR